jgi:urease accessory protein
MRIMITTIMAMVTAMVTVMAEPRPLPASHAPETSTPVSDEGITPAALKKLLAWLSPSFPVGGFSYSHGLEWAIEDGTVKTPADLEAWLADILRHGAGWSDAVLFAHAHRAASADDHAGLAAVNELAVALQPSKERHLEATAQGRAFLSTVAATWPNERLAAAASIFPAGDAVTYPVAVALACGVHDIPLGPALNACLGGFLANLVSAAVRAVPLGQTDGQRVIAALSPLVEATARSASAATLDDLGGAAWRADIASMKHETQYTRLFRS